MNEQLESHKRKYICLRKSVLLVLIILLFVIFCFYKWNEWSKTEFMPTDVHRTVITNGKDSLFITYWVGCLLGDCHELIISDRILTRDKIHFIIYNPDSVFIFKESLPIYYKFYNDTLHLYVNEDVKIPKYFNSNIKVITYNIDNDKTSYPELRKQYEKSLKKIEDYENSLSMPY